MSLLHQATCRHFFVTTPDEGIEVRDLTSSSIYILSGPTDEEAARLISEHQFIPVLNSRRQLRLWEPYREHPCAIHVDTGMQRLGFEPHTLSDQNCSRLDICLLMTHLACADQPKHPLNSKQLAEFKKAMNYFPNTPTSIGNSAGVLLGADFQGDITRPGIGLYGGNPFVDGESPVEPVCTLEAQVLQVRSVASNTPVGYGASFTTCSPSRVAIVGVGYADGLSRALSNRGWVAFEGQRMPIIGRVSMDAIQVDCTMVPDVQENDYVEIFGRTISVDEVASKTNTIAYEILTHVGNSPTFD